MNSALEQIYRTLTPEEQAASKKRPYYVMRLRFLLTISFSPNDILPNTMGTQETIAIPQEAVYRTTMVTRSIPDQAAIEEYRKALIESFMGNPNKKATLIRLGFDGYDYLYAAIPKEEADGVPTKDALEGLIRNGLENKAITIVPNPNGDGIHEPVMTIGTTWLHFDSEDPDVESSEPREYLSRHDNGYIIKRMADAVWDLYQSDPGDPESDYIFACLYLAMEQPVHCTEN